MDQKEIRNQIEDLIKINHTKTSNVRELITLNLEPTVHHLFNDEAKKILKLKSNSMIYQYNDCLTPGGEHLQKVSDFLIKIGIKSGTDIVVNYIRRIAPCKCFGYCVEYSKAAHAVLYMVNIINDLASMGAIKASLATIGSIELSNGNLIVFSYLNIDDNLLQIVDLKYKDTCMFEEGAIPKEFK